MNKISLTDFLKHFLALDDYTLVHIKTESPSGHREFAWSKPENLPTPETTAERVIRIHSTTDEYLSSEDSQWWKDIQLKLGGENQIKPGDSNEVIVKKLTTAGIS